MGKSKHSYEKVKELFEKNGYTLVDLVYKNCKTGLRAICKNGHNCSIRYDDLQHGHGCPDCAGVKKKTIEQIRTFFEKEGYGLISSEYVNSTTPLHVRCPQGHDSYPVYGNFQQGSRCLDCSGRKKKELEEVRSVFEKEGYRLISTEYECNGDRLHSIGPEKHSYFVAYSKFLRGDRCTDCSGRKKKTIEQAKELFESDGYKLISTAYIDNHEPLQSICPKGHDYSGSYANFQTGYRCSSCSKSGTSEPELELFCILKERFPNLIKKFFPIKIPGKPFIHGFQVDIFRSRN